MIVSSRGAAIADLDRDGDLEIVFSNIDAKPTLLRNDGGNARAWLMVRLQGTVSNRHGVGARLELEAGGRTLVREVNPFGSYQSQSTYWVHFGLGDAASADRLTVRWPSGAREQFRDLPAGRHVTIVEGEGVAGVEEAP